MVIRPNIISVNQDSLLTSASQMQEIRQYISQVQSDVVNAESELNKVCDGEFMQMFQNIKNTESTAFRTLATSIRGLEHSVIVYKDIMAKIDEEAGNSVHGISLNERDTRR